MTEKAKKIIQMTALLIVLASCGNNDNKNVQKEDSRRPVLSAETDIEETPDSTATPAPAPSYCIKLVNNTLSMYEVSGGTEILVKSILIDPSYYPSEDISELEGGITAYTKEDGFEILENFAN